MVQRYEDSLKPSPCRCSACIGRGQVKVGIVLQEQDARQDQHDFGPEPVESRFGLLSITKWFGTITGVVGCYMLAFNIPISKYAYVLYLTSSVSLTAVAARERDWQYLVLNTAFVTGNMIGVYRWLLT